MDQHVESDLLLQLHDAPDLGAHLVLVLGVGQLAPRVRGPRQPDLGRLREGADRRRRQRRQVEPGLLGGAARRERAAVEGLVVQPGDAVADGGHDDPGGGRAGGTGVGRREQRLVDRLPALGEAGRQGDDLDDLLVGERQPVLEGRVEVRLVGHVVRHVEQRGRRADRHRGGSHRLEPLERGQCRVEVRPPDVVAVDHAADQGRRLQARYPSGRQPAPDQVQRDRLDGGRGQGRQGRAEVAVGCRDEDRRAVGERAEHVVRAGRRGDQPLGRHGRRLGHERRLVELHPRGARGGQRGQHLPVDGEHVVEPVDRREVVGRPGGRLGQREERHRADQHGPGQHAVGEGLRELAHHAVVGEPERRRRPDLGDEVVVVRVEPLGHLEGQVVAAAAGQRRVAGQVQPPVGGRQVREPLRDGAGEHHRVEHLVVEREVARDRGVVGAQAERGQPVARALAQRGGGRLDLVGARPAGPEGLERLLQLAAGTDPGVAQDRAGGEGVGLRHQGFLGVGRAVRSAASSRSSAAS